MISISRRCIFIHVPKSGGSSIEKVFENHWDQKLAYNRVDQTFASNKQLDYLEAKKGQHDYIHANARELKRFYGDERFGSYFKFAVIRNPWDRLGSLYFWSYRGALTKRFDADGFIRRILPSGNTDVDKTDNRSTWSLKKYLCDNAGGLMVDFLINFNNFASDFEKVCKRLKIDNDLGVLNQNQHQIIKDNNRDYRKIMGPKVCRMIRHYYSKEIELFFPDLMDQYQWNGVQ